MTDRREFLQFAGAGGVALLHSDAAAAVAGTPAGVATASVAPLLSVGLDPFDTYCRLFASRNAGDECAWWFMGALPMQVPDVGPVDWIQEETIRVHRVERAESGVLDIVWREVGVFRDITTGLVPTGWFDPARGVVVPQNARLRGGPSRQRVRKAGDAVVLEMQAKNIASWRITLDGAVEGDRVCLTHVEEKTRAGGTAPASTLRTVFKVYASLAELRGMSPSVRASGFYGVRNVGTGNVFVNGLMQKAALDEKVNELAWERVKAKAPEFFDGERLAPGWQEDAA